MKHTTEGNVYARVSQGGEGLQSVEGSRSDGGQLVVVQGEQTDVVKPCETVVVDTADLIVPQHPKEERRETPRPEKSEIFSCILELSTWLSVCLRVCLSLTAYAVLQARGTSRFGLSRSDWL